MITMTCQEAFAAYEAVRHRLPAVQRSAPCTNLENLDDLADHFDVFLLDAFGVLNIGETAIPGTPGRVAGLQAAGKRVLVVTNAASVSRTSLVNKYRKLGYDFAPEDVISSRKAVLNRLKKLPKMRWGVMLNPALGSDEIGHLDFEWLLDDPETYDGVDGFLMLGSAGWTPERQALLENTLSKNPRPVLVGNPDIIAPRENGFSLEPGYYAHRLADRVAVEPEFHGKPFPGIYDEAFKRLSPGQDRSRIVMVGDSLHTDILGGTVAGVKTALIKSYGFFQGHDTNAPVSNSGIEPDYILNTP